MHLIYVLRETPKNCYLTLRNRMAAVRSTIANQCDKTLALLPEAIWKMLQEANRSAAAADRAGDEADIGRLTLLTIRRLWTPCWKKQNKWCVQMALLLLTDGIRTKVDIFLIVRMRIKNKINVNWYLLLLLLNIQRALVLLRPK